MKTHARNIFYCMYSKLSFSNNFLTNTICFHISVASQTMKNVKPVDLFGLLLLDDLNRNHRRFLRVAIQHSIKPRKNECVYTSNACCGGDIWLTKEEMTSSNSMTTSGWSLCSPDRLLCIFCMHLNYVLKSVKSYLSMISVI